MIDLTIPQWLVNYYYSVGVVSLFINSLTIYLIIYRSDKIDSFRYYILVFQVNCAITDVHVTILMQPLPLHPMLCGHYKGLIGSNFNVFAYYQVAFSITSIVTQVEALVYCFHRKHQTIAKVMDGRIYPKSFDYFMHVVSTGATVFTFYALVKAGMTREEQLDYVKTNYPEIFGEFITLTNVALFTLNDWIILICINSLIGGLVSGFAFTSTTLSLLKMLRNMRKKVSAYNYQRHKAAVHSLVAQFVASSVMLTPPFVFMVLSTGGHANLYIQLVLTVVSLRSMINAIVLIVTTAPYRKFVFRIKPILSSVVVSSVVNSL
ncbi:CBN-SRI-37 protein [Caenorhabditis brenneri]|uniref:CBN-SRI-37 protein n=1 Tax=Caenorhabditis brenneri TaxID=135651 RepID=G0NL45_CAEBE|nr:CBN-SRI-37 protein [Caenorhabditis brenneri]